jgi:diacylglycerol kinase
MTTEGDTPQTVSPIPPLEQTVPIVMSTMQIDPAQYTYQRAGGRWRALLFAVAGLLYLVRRQPSIRAMLLVTTVCVVLASWLQISLELFLEMLLVIGLVWITEALNTALEAAVDIMAPNYHPLAKVSKDVAASASLIAMFLATIVTLLILLPPLAARLL